MDTLPYELYDIILKYINQSDILYLIESSKLSRLFSYLLRIYTIHNYDQVFNKKHCLVKITTSGFYLDGNYLYVRNNPDLGRYIPITLRSLELVESLDKNVILPPIKLQPMMNKLIEFTNHTSHYHDASKLKLKKFSTCASETKLHKYPIGLEMLRISHPINHNTVFKKIPNTVKYLNLHFTFCQQILRFPPKLEILIVSQWFNSDLPKLPNSLKTIGLSSEFNGNWNVISESNVTRLIYFLLLPSSPINNLEKFTKIKCFQIISVYFITLNNCPPNIEVLIAKNCKIDIPLPLSVKKLSCFSSYIPNSNHNIRSLNYHAFYTNHVSQIYPHLTLLNMEQNITAFDFPLDLVKLTIRNYFHPANIDKLTKLKVLKIFSRQESLDLSFVPKSLIYFKLDCQDSQILSINNHDLPYLKKLETNCLTFGLHFIPSLRYLICPKSGEIPKYVKYVTLI